MLITVLPAAATNQPPKVERLKQRLISHSQKFKVVGQVALFPSVIQRPRVLPRGRSPIPDPPGAPSFYRQTESRVWKAHTCLLKASAQK